MAWQNPPVPNKGEPMKKLIIVLAVLTLGAAAFAFVKNRQSA